MKLRLLFCLIAFLRVLHAQSQTAPPIPELDKRYKVDILVVVGHPDDDIEVSAYLAKQIEQQHKRIAVVYTTRGNTGGNAAGQEQASALPHTNPANSRCFSL
jgi:hypothetical protein